MMTYLRFLFLLFLTGLGQCLCTSPVLVLPGTSKVASETIRQLIEKGIPVRTLVLDMNKAAELEALNGAEIIQGDMLSLNDVYNVLPGIERVFFVPPDSSITHTMIRNVLKACMNTAVKHIVKLSIEGSSSGLLPLLTYHEEGDRYLARMQQKGMLDITILEANTFMQNIHNPLHPHSPLPDGKLQSTQSLVVKQALVDSRDVSAVAATLLALPNEDLKIHAGMTYQLTGPEGLSVGQMASLFTDILGLDHHPVLDEEATATLTGPKTFSLPAAAVGSISTPPTEIDCIQLLHDEYRHLAMFSGLMGFFADHLDSVYGPDSYFGKGLAGTPTDWVFKLTGRRPKSFSSYVREYHDELITQLGRDPSKAIQYSHDEL